MTLSLRDRLVWQVGFSVPAIFFILTTTRFDVLLLALIGGIALLALHEPAHLLGFRLVGIRAKLTVVGKPLPTVAVQFARAVNVGAYRVGLLTPTVIMLAVVAIGVGTSSSTVMGAGLLGLSSVSSDLAVAWLTKGVRGKVRDHPTDIGVLAEG